MYSLPALEARSPKSGVDRTMLPLMYAGKNTSLSLSSFWWFAGNLRHFLADIGVNNTLSWGVLPDCLCFHVLFSKKDTSHVELAAHPTPVGPHLALINYN